VPEEEVMAETTTKLTPEQAARAAGDAWFRVLKTRDRVDEAHRAHEAAKGTAVTALADWSRAKEELEASVLADAQADYADPTRGTR
jgi:hypothetical protein